MEATETASNGKQTGKNTRITNETKPKQQRRQRPVPVAFSAQELKAVAFGLPKVAQKGISFDSKALRLYAPFSLTADGESICVKKSKSEAIRLIDGCLFDAAGLTVYPLIW